MAPIKRQYDSVDPDDPESESEASSSATASSPPQPDSRKKPRTAQNGNSSRREAGANTENDGNSDDSEDEDAFIERLEALKRRAPRGDEEPPEADSGILMKVECVNFMCHDHLVVELSGFMNFIVGNNGSGKSAVLTALILCLGGKAATTNRASNLKNLVKTGKEMATVKVTIKNEGEDAYLPGDYGDSITVERHFTRQGTSGFKLRSSYGRVVSTKRGDLDDITDYFALQIDNPLNVLSQDMARAFLSSSNPETKYKFFVKGVQLEQLDQDYRLLEGSIDGIENKLGARIDDLKVLQSRRDKAKQKLEMSDRFEATRAKLRILGRQMAWAQVEEQERLRDSCDDELQKADAEVAKLESRIQTLDAVFTQNDRTTTEAQQLVNGVQAELGSRKEEKDELKTKLDEAKKERTKLHDDERQIASQIRATETQIEKAKQDIQAEIQRLEDLNGGSDTRLRAELERREEEFQEASRRHDDHRKDIGRLESELRDQEKRHGKSKEPVEAKEREIQQSDNLLRTLQRTRGQEQSGFSDKLRVLLRAIEQETAFRQRPVGPVGHHVRLIEPKWSSIIESVLGTVLESFIVSSKADQTLLDGIMRRTNCPYPILIGGFDPIDTRAHEPSDEYLTVLRALEIDSDAVRRQLVITQGIEQQLLIENQDEAHRVMYGGSPPRNVKMCFHMHPTRRGFGLRLSYNKAGGESSGPVRPYQGKPRMKTDIESQISLATENLQHLRRERKELEEQERACQQDLQKAKQAIVRHRREEQQLKIDSQRAQESVDLAREELDKASVEIGRLDQLKVGLKDAQDEKAIHEGSYTSSIEAKEAASEVLRLARKECDAKDREIEEVEGRVQTLESELQRLRHKRESALREKNAAFDEVEKAKRVKSKFQDKRAQIVQTINEYTDLASQISPRIPIEEGETTNSLEVKLARLTKEVQRHSQDMGGTRDEFVARAAETEEAYKLAHHQVDGLEQLAQVLKNSLVNRRQRWKNFRSHITARAKANFVALLSERGFRGKLLTNHRNQLLDIQVEPDVMKNSDGRGARTLSGGEKSFSQICMLLALWEAMGSPIRCLDEFDVFMDSVNRKISIGMIVEAARNSLMKQFVLISPGTKSDITIKPGVRVTQLQAPERAHASQRTIQFSS